MLIFRMSIGLVQGLLLYTIYCLYGDGKGPLPYLAVILPAMTILAVVPLIVITGINNIKPRLLAAWALTSTIVLTVVSLNLIVRGVSGWQTRVAEDNFNNFPTLIATVAALFIAHSLVGAASAENKRIASYSVYFDAAWKLAVQAALSGAFLGVFWLLLQLGASLFEITGLHFFQKTIESIWFALPVSTVVTAAAIHITDVRPAIIQGVRTLKLTLLSWLLPVIAAITAMFLASLCITGLAPVWGTHHAAALFLATALVLIYTLNAAYQDGGVTQTQNKFLRRVGQATALLLLPLIALAIYGTGIRIEADGLTNDRFYLLALLIIVAQHATGYTAALFDRRGWMKRLEATNISTAFVALGLYLLLFTPIADPVRLSVRDQVARLKHGRVKPDKFDYYYLYHEGAGYGKAALLNLAANKENPEIREQAYDFLERQEFPNRRIMPDDMAESVTIHPAGATMPQEFWQQDWSDPKIAAYRNCGRDNNQCDVTIIPGSGNDFPKIILSSKLWGQVNVFVKEMDGSWHISGTYLDNSRCTSTLMDALHQSSFTFAPNPYPDLVVAGQHFPFQPSNTQTGCP